MCIHVLSSRHILYVSPRRDRRATGAMAEPQEIKILQPDDFHHHFRDEPFLEHTVIFG